MLVFFFLSKNYYYYYYYWGVQGVTLIGPSQKKNIGTLDMPPRALCLFHRYKMLAYGASLFG
jgi:hypothetical protein